MQRDAIYHMERHLFLPLLVFISYKQTRKTARTAENPSHPQIILCDIQINMLQTMYISPNIQNLSDFGFDL